MKRSRFFRFMTQVVLFTFSFQYTVYATPARPARSSSRKAEVFVTVSAASLLPSALSAPELVQTTAPGVRSSSSESLSVARGELPGFSLNNNEGSRYSKTLDSGSSRGGRRAHPTKRSLTAGEIASAAAPPSTDDDPLPAVRPTLNAQLTPSVLASLGLLAQVMPTRSYGFPSGWSLVSVPLIPTDPDPSAVFDEVPAPLHLYDYVSGRTLGVDEIGFRDVVPGRAYWLFLEDPVTVSVSGPPVSVSAPYSIPIVEGWNAIAGPWVTTVDWSDERVTVSDGAEEVALTEALASRGWIEDLMEYDASLDALQPIAPDGGALEPWQGYFIYSTIAGQIRLAPPPPDIKPPTVAITFPADGEAVTAPTDVIGTADDESLVQWTLEYAPVGGEYATLADGVSPVVEGVLGRLEPTLLMNGIYQLRLSAVDADGRMASTTSSIVVKGAMKVGHFSVSFTDLEVPVAGTPITVTRTYDSRDKRKGDFGYGWRLDLSSVEVMANGVIGQGWKETVNQSGLITQYCLPPTRAHLVIVRFPDGQVYEFEPKLTPDCQPLDPIDAVHVDYVARAGTEATLTTDYDLYNPGYYNVLVEYGYSDGPHLVDWSWNDYNPSRFFLTLPDGRVFTINKSSGLESIVDLNGNQLTVTPGGVTYSNAAVAGSEKQVVFTRDGQGRITNITDPMTNVMTYGYDDNGDLVSFKEPQEDGQEEIETTFTYYEEIPHHLHEIFDPLGRRPIRNVYDDEGRLLSHEDAFGKVITYTHDVDGREEIVTDRLGNPRSLVYDDHGNVLQEVQPDGSVIVRTFDALDNKLSETAPYQPGDTHHTTYYEYAPGTRNLTKVTDPLGNVTEHRYNARNQVTHTKDARNNWTVNEYDARGNLIRTEVRQGGENGTALSRTESDYDDQGNVTAQRVWTSVAGNEHVSTLSTYDAHGNPTEERDANDHPATYTYDANGNRLTQETTRTLAGGSVETVRTTYAYDKKGRLLSTTNSPCGCVTSTEYDELGRQKAAIDAMGRRTEYVYDEGGRLTETRYPDETTEKSEYDEEGRRKKHWDRANRLTEYTYDEMGRLKTTKYLDGAVTENFYDGAGRLIEARDARGNSTHYGYDDAGRRTTVTQMHGAEALTTTFGYDANGNQTSVLDPKGNTTTYVYDEQNRRIRTDFPPAQTGDTPTSISTAYDDMGRRVSETDQAGKTTRFEYDALGRLTAVVDALNQRTEYGYDEAGNRVSQKDAEGRVTSFEYDSMGRETARVLPGGARENKSYHADGSLWTHVDFMSRATTYAYESDTGRLESKTYSSGGSVSYTYTPTGRRETVTSTVYGVPSTVSYAYDVRDRLTSATSPQGRLEYGHDLNGNRTSLTATIGGSTITTLYEHDPLNRLDVVTDPLGRVYDHGYDDNGNRETLLQPNGTSTGYVYDNLNRLTRLATSGPLGHVQSYDFTLGLAGNRTRIVENGGIADKQRTLDYGYDDIYRLTGETVNALVGGLVYEKAFVYDKVGNREQQTTSLGTAAPSGMAGGSITYDYDVRDRLLQEGGEIYGWDDNGNLTSKSGEATYAWNQENCLIRVDKADGTVVEHVYDADGNRVRTSTTLPGQPTQIVNYLVDASGGLSHVVAEADPVGNLIAYYVRDDDLLSVIRPTAPGPLTTANSLTRYYHADGIGSVRVLTDETGAITDTYTYTAFGELIEHTGTDPQPYAFTGEPLDPNVGFQYHRARWMDPRVGRWASIDVWRGFMFDLVTLHGYMYADSRPIGGADPTGLQFVSVAMTALSVMNTINSISQPVFSTPRARDYKIRFTRNAWMQDSRRDHKGIRYYFNWFDVEITANVPSPHNYTYKQWAEQKEDFKGRKEFGEPGYARFDGPYEQNISRTSTTISMLDAPGYPPASMVVTSFTGTEIYYENGVRRWLFPIRATANFKTRVVSKTNLLDYDEMHWHYKLQCSTPESCEIHEIGEGFE